jgi:copper chaperone CopZ
MTATFTTPGIRCGGCAANVKATLSRQRGVQAVHVTLPAKRVEVAYDAAVTSPQRLRDALSAAGYPPADADADPAPADLVPNARLDAALL